MEDRRKCLLCRSSSLWVRSNSNREEEEGGVRENILLIRLNFQKDREDEEVQGTEARFDTGCKN